MVIFFFSSPSPAISQRYLLRESRSTLLHSLAVFRVLAVVESSNESLRDRHREAGSPSPQHSLKMHGLPRATVEGLASSTGTVTRWLAATISRGLRRESGRSYSVRRAWRKFSETPRRMPVAHRRLTVVASIDGVSWLRRNAPRRVRRRAAHVALSRMFVDVAEPWVTHERLGSHVLWPATKGFRAPTGVSHRPAATPRGMGRSKPPTGSRRQIQCKFRQSGV